MSIDTVAAWGVWGLTAFFVQWTYRVARREFRKEKPAAIEACRANIRRMEIEVYGSVRSGSLVTDADVAEVREHVQRIGKELASRVQRRSATANAAVKQALAKEIFYWQLKEQRSEENRYKRMKVHHLR